MSWKKQIALVVVLLVLAAMAFGIKTWIGEPDDPSNSASATPTASSTPSADSSDSPDSARSTDSPDSSADGSTLGDDAKSGDEKPAAPKTGAPKASSPARSRPSNPAASSTVPRHSTSTIAHRIAHQLNAETDIPVRVECPPTFVSRRGATFECNAFDPRAAESTMRQVAVRIGANDAFTWSSYR